MKVRSAFGSLVDEGARRIKAVIHIRAVKLASKFGLDTGWSIRLWPASAEREGETHYSIVSSGARAQEVAMEVVHSRCCGIDIHKRTLSACISIKDGSEQEKHKRRFGTTTDELRQLAAWLVECRVRDVAMEATGVYWKPVWNVLEGQFKLLLANPQHLKAIPGKKTDFKDGERIADLMQHGLLR